MKRALAGTLALLALAACQKKAQPADDGFGAGAAPPPAATDTAMSDTMRIRPVPVDSVNRPQ